jgi:hypothetical protein
MLDEQQEGASRFFYCAKASKKERNMGLEDIEPTTVDDGRNKPIDNPFLRGGCRRRLGMLGLRRRGLNAQMVSRGGGVAHLT